MSDKKAIFIDRDGTLIEEKNYLHQPEQVKFFPGSIAALKKAVNAGFTIVMITNQSGVGRGYFTMADVERVHERICGDLIAQEVSLIKIYIAPEAPDHPSRGRKPSPQFLFDARDEFDLDLARSYMIGDKLIDLECGWNAGIRRSILVRTGYGRELEAQSREQLKDAVVVDDITAAVDWIIRDAAF